MFQPPNNCRFHNRLQLQRPRLTSTGGAALGHSLPHHTGVASLVHPPQHAAVGAGEIRREDVVLCSDTTKQQQQQEVVSSGHSSMWYGLSLRNVQAPGSAVLAAVKAQLAVAIGAGTSHCCEASIRQQWCWQWQDSTGYISVVTAEEHCITRSDKPRHKACAPTRL